MNQNVEKHKACLKYSVLNTNPMQVSSHENVLYSLFSFILRIIIVYNVNCTWNYLVIHLQHPMCRQKYVHLCCCSSYSCSAAFPIQRMGNMQAI